MDGELFAPKGGGSGRGRGRGRGAEEHGGVGGDTHGGDRPVGPVEKQSGVGGRRARNDPRRGGGRGRRRQQGRGGGDNNKRGGKRRSTSKIKRVLVWRPFILSIKQGTLRNLCVKNQGGKATRADFWVLDLERTHIGGNLCCSAPPGRHPVSQRQWVFCPFIQKCEKSANIACKKVR